MNSLDFGTDLFTLVEQLEKNISELDREEKESGITPFSGSDPLRNLKRSVAYKIASKTGRTVRDCEQEANELVDKIQQELTKPNSKKRICAALRLLSNDISGISVGTVSAVIATLLSGGLITLSFSSPIMIAAIGGFVFIRSSIELICFDNQND
ncbi:hypothetical protein Lepto7376_3255 [[Leptolyngbya] sp. PCC 7376]|uniref:hypothetical protein n=1 Tax=[Leptolyngbya] sp. PCC 7376 TaxID=111781 RepID=UPI00029F11BC|nr:hypothetical protein [[Leptolyngbya] sp. PCC 7376]AFY39483.1 hypothetical protein Lepto7376_3255 [[Leptolyngbya] sp. PCC 7376]